MRLVSYLKAMIAIVSMLLMAALVAVLGILIVGVAVFAKGGAFNERHASHLMTLRVAVQGVAVLLLGLLLLLRALEGGP